MKERTFEQAFSRYDHYFDFIIALVKEIRRLKGDSKRIDSVFINIRNCEYKLALVLECADKILKMCKVDSLFINFIDDESNHLNFKFNRNGTLS
jgi:hypothetical protein